MLCDEVFADDKITPGGGAKIIAVGDEVALAWLEEEFELIVCLSVFSWNEAVYLTLFLRAAIGAADVDGAIGVFDSFAAGEAGGSVFEASNAEVVSRRVDVFQIDPFNVHQKAFFNGETTTSFVTEVGRGSAFDGEGLEFSFAEIFFDLGDKAIDEAIASVFGKIDDAGVRIDGDRFVAIATKTFESDGFLEFAIVAGFDFETVTVLFTTWAGEVGRLFAGDPGSPRSFSAGAVSVSANQREKFTKNDSTFEVVDKVGGSADVGVFTALSVIVGKAFVKIIGDATATVGTGFLGVGSEFVVADQNDGVGLTKEASHAVRHTGSLKAIVHGVAAFGDDLVGEAFGEIENAVGILDEIAVRRNDAIAFLGAEVFLQTKVSEGAG